MRIGIIGTGYVGLVTGTCFASLGMDVTLHDKDTSKIIKLQRGKVPFYEPGLEDLMLSSKAKGCLKFTNSFKKLFTNSNVIFVCVGSPQRKNGKPNLSYVKEVFDQMRLEYFNLDHKSMELKTIFIKSTVPPGTTNEMRQMLKQKKIHNILCGANPEFLREGSAIFDFFNPDRVVVGAEDKSVEVVAQKLYLKVAKKHKLLLTSIQSAELIKYASNAFLATKISFINELSRLADQINADISDVSKGIGMDKRIGSSFLNAGLGYGGSCFPKDSLGLSYIFKKNSLQGNIIDAVIQTNNSQKDYFLKKIFSFYSKKQLEKVEILFWGTAFKPNTDDIRESIGIKLIRSLSSLVKKINIYEPIAIQNSKNALADLHNINFLRKPVMNISKNSFLVVCTEYDEFNNIPLQDIAMLKDKVVFDGRNILNKDGLSKLGIKYFGIGR